MKALIQKELRENQNVAWLGLLIFSVLVLAVYLSSIAALAHLLDGSESVDFNVLQPLLSQNLLAEAPVFCAIFGVVLGWLQSRNEAHRDLWAFLIHRPVTRTEIFQGKTIAGLCLYAGGAGLPLAVLVAVARIPGHVAAPFEWAMALPLAAIFLTGVPWYFAGLLTGLRQARWYASRGFGLVLALLPSVCVFNLPEFWQALIPIVVAVAVLGTAVWGAYQSGGYYRGQPGIGRAALIVAMTAGCGGALYAGAGLLVNLILNPWSNPSYVNTVYAMTQDGSLYRMTTRINPQLSVEIVDLDGHPLLDPKTGQKMTLEEFRKHFGGGANIAAGREYQGNFLTEARFFNLWSTTDKALWYLDRHGNLNGYDARTRRYTGSLNPQGNPGSSRTEPFLRRTDSGNYFMSPERRLIATARVLYQVDFKARALQPVFSLTNEDEIRGFCGFVASMYYGDANDQTKSLFLASKRAVRLLDSEGQAVFAVPHPGSVEYPQVQVSFLHATNGSTANFAIWFWPDNEMNAKSGWKMPIHVVWIGPGQTVAKSADLPFLRMSAISSWPDELAGTLLPPFAHWMTDKNIYSPWNAVGFALALISAGIAWWLTRRYNFSIPAALGWTLFVFLLGIAGLLTLLCAQEWPAREPCPNCKKLRVVDRALCEHCQSPFSPPAKNGTEIFAPLASDSG
jgi:hypothetical protein